MECDKTRLRNPSLFQVHFPNFVFIELKLRINGLYLYIVFFSFGFWVVVFVDHQNQLRMSVNGFLQFLARKQAASLNVQRKFPYSGSLKLLCYLWWEWRKGLSRKLWCVFRSFVWVAGMAEWWNGVAFFSSGNSPFCFRLKIGSLTGFHWDHGLNLFKAGFPTKTKWHFFHPRKPLVIMPDQGTFF